MRILLSIYLGFALLAFGPVLSNTDQELDVAAEIDHVVHPFLSEHCRRCHGETKQEGGFWLDALLRNFAGGGTAVGWSDIMHNISYAKMPQEDEPQPTAEEAAKVFEWLGGRLKEGEVARVTQQERVTCRKLTRVEYANNFRETPDAFFGTAL